jgi:hypothetical protein
MIDPALSLPAAAWRYDLLTRQEQRRWEQAVNELTIPPPEAQNGSCHGAGVSRNARATLPRGYSEPHSPGAMERQQPGPGAPSLTWK